ncbi:MAG: histidine phosphatase family protein [Aggregatilineales bacterium]
MSVQRVYIVRHGETAYNYARRLQGFLPVPLNETGQAQATALGDYLKDTRIDMVYTSDLQRCTETAELACGGRDLTIVHDERLREVNLGQFQGLTRDQIAELYPLEYMRWSGNDAYVVPGGESRIMVKKRMHIAWKDIIATSTGEHIMIVSHGGAIRQLLLAILDTDSVSSTGIPNTSLTILNRHEEIWQAELLAATPHLT